MWRSLWAFLLNTRAKPYADRVLDSLGINGGDVIADVGAGGGYFTLRIAERTGPDGLVYAVDTDAGLLAYIDRKVRKRGISNIKTLPGDQEGLCLPKESCDLIYMRNVFHHIHEPGRYFANLRQGLKRGGRIAILEWSEGAGGHVGREGHFTPEETIIGAMASAGLARKENYDFLEGQSFNIFG